MLCFHRCLSVDNEGCLCPGVSVQWGVCPGGLCPGGLCPGGLCQGDPLYGKERVVRILLECTLVKACDKFQLTIGPVAPVGPFPPRAPAAPVAPCRTPLASSPGGSNRTSSSKSTSGFSLTPFNSRFTSRAHGSSSTSRAQVPRRSS